MKLSKISALFAIAALTATLLPSCQKEDDSPFGILTMSLTMPNGKTVACAVNQELLTIDNAADPVEVGMPAPLYTMKVTYTATLDTKVTYNGADLVSGETAIDFSAPVTLVASKQGKKTVRTNTYTVTLKSDTNDKSETEGKKVNADMTSGGFPKALYYDIALFKDAFWAITATYPNGTSPKDPAFYHVYKSIDGISWEKVATNLKIIGGVGARLVVFKDKLWSFGGGRYYGTDEEGNESSLSWDGVSPEMDIPEFFVYSTSDGTNWAKETVEVEGSAFALPGCIDPKVVNTGSTLVYLGSLVASFGMLQGAAAIVTSTDGIHWKVNADANKAENAGAAFLREKINSCAYSFNGKLYNAGGFDNFVDPKYLKTNVFVSADNGATWSLAAEDGGFSPRFGMRVVGTDKVLYMVGGQTFDKDGKTPVASNQVYRSTDGAHWTALSGENAMASAFEGRVRANVVAYGDMMWVFGGRGLTSGFYGAIDAKDPVLYDVWKKRIK